MTLTQNQQAKVYIIDDNYFLKLNSIDMNDIRKKEIELARVLSNGITSILSSDLNEKSIKNIYFSFLEKLYKRFPNNRKISADYKVARQNMSKTN